MGWSRNTQDETVSKLNLKGKMMRDSMLKQKSNNVLEKDIDIVRLYTIYIYSLMYITTVPRI